MKNRCYLIGNGPSLSPAQLDKIIGEPAVACNRISRIYPKTEWRPSHFVVVTVNVRLIPWYIDILKTIRLGIPSYVWNYLKDYIPTANNIKHIECHQTGIITPAEDDWWHDDIDNAVTHWGGSGTAMMQIAAGLGHKEIVLLGFDANWKLGINGQDLNHFDRGYGEGSGFERIGKINLWNMCAKNSHDWMRRMTEERGITVLNATPGSGIKAYPMVNLEDIL
jgi:hypothetical protein